MPRTLLRLAGVLALLVLATACGNDSPTTDDPAAQVPEPSSGGLVSFFGRVDDIGAGQLVVAGRAFGVDGDTHVFLQQNEAPFSILHVGDLVLVRARQNRTGVWLAREIKVRIDAPPEVKITGRVDSIKSPELVVAGQRVVAGPDTAFLGAGEPRSLADIRGGDLVTVTGFEVEKGVGVGVGVIQAVKIRVESKS